MRHTLAVVFIAFIIAFAGIGGWYYYHTNQIEGETNQYVDWAKNQKMVDVEFIVTAPAAETPKDQMLYISGDAPNLGVWDGAGLALKKGDDGKYHGTVQLLSGIEHAFKVTRGTWSTVERAADGGEIPNHTFTVEKPEKVKVTVASWVDHGKAIPGRITMTGDIRQHKKFHSELLKNDRTIIVYLPPGYEDDESKRYPVLYMHDGQNLFDEATSFQGIEWKLDETAQRLISSGKVQPVIIVGVYNFETRNSEFAPPMFVGKGKGTGDLYARFVVEEVKPFIDRVYRTMPQRATTALAGSSMGGEITLYMAKAHNPVFGQIAVLTPWLRMNNASIVPALTSPDSSWMKNTRMYVEMGGVGGDNYPGKDPIGDAKEFVKALDNAGLKAGKDYQYVELPSGQHNETAWQGQVEPMLTFLFPGKVGEQAATTSSSK